MSHIAQPAPAGHPADVVLIIPRACPPEDGCPTCAARGACPTEVPVSELSTEEIAAILSMRSACPVEAALLAHARAAVLAFLDDELALDVAADSAERSAA